jgi:hypothetical protein
LVINGGVDIFLFPGRNLATSSPTCRGKTFGQIDFYTAFKRLSSGVGKSSPRGQDDFQIA